MVVDDRLADLLISETAEIQECLYTVSLGEPVASDPCSWLKGVTGCGPLLLSPIMI